jgi:2-haloalkanoic acid dehalogenase type II
MRPQLLTFDFFGTALDWQTGIANDVREAGFDFRIPQDTDRIIDIQGRDEQRAPFKSYRNIVANSLVEAFKMPPETADAIGSKAGEWPLFADSREAMRALMQIAPCAAMTNSDRAHGEQIQRQLGFSLSHWFCAEETRVYKPNPDFWKYVSEKTGIAYGRHWWHVSAYADYDLNVARELGLTCVFIARPHSREGLANSRFNDLLELGKWLSR